MDTTAITTTINNTTMSSLHEFMSNIMILFIYKKIFERTYHIEQAQLPIPTSSMNSKESIPNQIYIESMFNYAWACCRSPRSQDIPQGIRLMKGKST